MALKVGDRMGDYEVVGVLGAGGMGKVYKVRNVISERIEAMKVLLPDLVNEPDLADRFMREIKVLASLDHPNIAALYTASRIDNQLVMIMEFVDGVTLADLAKQGRIPIVDCIQYIDRVLAALSCAHEHGVVHRDIKPANMMLTPEGIIKLMDFGIARTAEDHKLTVTGTTLGSLYYMSPEQVKCGAVDGRSDLYSVGITLYEIATGARPFQADSSYALMAAQLQETPRPPIEVDPEIPAALNDIILRALEKEPEQRFQTADAFRAALENVKESLGLPATSAPAVGADSGLAEPTSATLTMHSPLAPLPASVPPAPAVMAPPPAPQAMAAPAPPQAITDSLPSPPRPAGTHRALYMAIGAILAIAVIVAAATQLPRWLRTRAAETAQTASSNNPPEATASSSNPSPQQESVPATSSPQAAAESSGANSSPSPTMPPSEPSAVTNQAGQNASLPPGAPAQRTGHKGASAQGRETAAGSTRLGGASGAVPATPAARAFQAVESSTSEQTAPAAVQPSAAQPNASGAIEELQEKMVALGARASAAKESVENLRRQQQSQGLNLRADIGAALNRMEQYMNRADAALAAHDPNAAARNMDLAEREVDKLDKFLGR
jgi:serine/threonine-protein kinase